MEKRKTTYQIFLSLISIYILFFFSGCNLINLNKTEPEKTYYAFNEIENHKGSKKHQPLSSELILMQFTSTPEFRGNKFIYKKKNQFVKDYYNRFFFPPEKMIQSICAKWLNNSEIFKTVSTKSQASSSDLILKGKILEIYCDRTEHTTSYAIIKIRFSLKKYNAADKTIVEKDLYSKIKFNDFSSDNLINAWKKCLEKIFQSLESEISSVI
ncbi:MAG: hypothetical protein K8R67_15415 [Desulfobacteraceae bacterium]|nr:hypothetical protein [Desulfobacteraceae bacterium]